MPIKPKRLRQVARELNVGISTIVDFLSDNGHEVANNPNSKIEPDVYKLLLAEYQAEKAEREEALAVSQNKVVRETISLEDAVKERGKEPEQDEILIKNLGAGSDRPVVEPTPEPEVAKEEPAPAPEPEPEQKEAPAEPEAKQEEPPVEAKKEEAPAPEKTEAADEGGPKVVDKIDLDSLNLKTRPGRKKKEEAPKAEKPKPEAAKAKEEKAEAPKEEAPKEEAKPEAEKAKPENEVIRAKADKLAGVTVVRKIELPEEPKKKKPVASSSEGTSEPKKKRRRRIQNEAKPQQGGNDRGRQRGGKKKGQPKPEVSPEEISQQIRETLARLSGGGKSKGAKLRREKRQERAEQAEQAAEAAAADAQVLKVTEFVTANELANMMSVGVTEVISACMSLGLFVSINQRLDAETLSIVAEEFGYKVEFVSTEVAEAIVVEEDAPEDLQARPPIVTVMGHVDHGKTSLLDYIRSTNVIGGEAGGITQHIGSYLVTLEDGREIAFLDTPGHEAFTAMRARGAQVTDVVIIVVAADDSVMPQTEEAINHAQAAGVPIVFAINKIDRPNANPDKIKEALSTRNILVEDWGGKFQSQDISAKKGTNVDELLDKVLLEAEMLDLKANPDKPAVGAVIESSLDKGMGYVTNILVQGGTLRIGDIMLAGCYTGRVKAMYNERGQRVDEAGPSHPVKVLGLNGAPNAGDKFNVMLDEKEARNIATKRLQLQREQGIRTQKHLTLDEIGRRLALGDFKELNVIVKGDVDGSVEAISDSLLKLSTEKIQVNVIHKSVGAITESDVLLASASDAIILGFQVRPTGNARKVAEKEEIDIRLYSIIYDAIEEVKAAMEGLLEAKLEEKVVCNIEVRETFKISKVGTIAGCYVLDGKVNRNTKIRLIRDGIVVYSGELGSLKRFKDDVKEVAAGYECGLNIANYNDIKVGDIIEGFEEVEVKQTL